MNSYSQNARTSSGTIVHHPNFPSQFVQPRNVDVWLPEGYDASKEYAVLYMNDGQMLFDSSITWNGQEWQVDETLSKLMKSKEIQDCIVVAIWNIPEKRHSEYFPAKAAPDVDAVYLDSLKSLEWLNAMPTSDNYLSFIVRELKPFIDNNYATKTDRASTLIAGSSMGGLISLYAICEYPAVFGGAICMSTHWPGSLKVGGESIPAALLNYYRKHLPNPETHKIYFDLGTENLDKKYPANQRLMNRYMKKRGYNFSSWQTQFIQGGDHSERSWSKRFPAAILFMLER